MIRAMLVAAALFDRFRTPPTFERVEADGMVWFDESQYITPGQVARTAPFLFCNPQQLRNLERVYRKTRIYMPSTRPGRREYFRCPGRPRHDPAPVPRA